MAKFNVRNFFSSLRTTGNLSSSKNTQNSAKLKSGGRVNPLFTGNNNNKHTDKFWKAYGVSTMKETSANIAGSASSTYSAATSIESVIFARRGNRVKIGKSDQG